MKLIVLVNGDGPEMRESRARAEEIEAEGFEVEVLDWESDDAVSIAKIYDIYSTPAFIVTGPEGRLIELWQGQELPAITNIKHLL